MTTDHRQQANQAAAEALREHRTSLAPIGTRHPMRCRCGWTGHADAEHAAEAAVAAAEPHLRALVAEVIRAHDEAQAVGPLGRLRDFGSGLRTAARIAEATP